MIQLVVTLKGHAVGQFRLEQPVVGVGRNPDNAVQIDNRSVSRYHCRLVHDPASGWRVEDLGSHNGTYLNGARLEQPAPLQSGDTLGVGQFHVTVQSDESSAFEATAAASLAVRPGGGPEERERRAPERGFLLREGTSAPLRLERDLFQIGAASEVDLLVPGPPKAALIVRGYGGFQLVVIDPERAPVRLDGAPLRDRAWLAEGARIEVGGLSLRFHGGRPTEQGQSTLEMRVPDLPRGRSPLE